MTAKQYQEEYLGQFIDDNNPEGYKTHNEKAEKEKEIEALKAQIEMELVESCTVL